MASTTNQLVSAMDADRQESYFCPGCGQPVVIKRGTIKIAHFAHLRATCNSMAENESGNHLKGKLAFQQMAEDENVEGQLETYFREIDQRADVYLPTQRLAVEYQCSGITQKRLTERTSGYKSLGIDVIWVLGNPYLDRQLTAEILIKFARFNANVGFYLLYWDAVGARFILLDNIVECAGRFEYQTVYFTSYMNLRSYFARGHFKRQLLTNNQLMGQLAGIQSQVVKQRTSIVYMVTQCYQKGRVLVACPIIGHGTEAGNPVFGKQTLFWRVLILLRIFERPERVVTKRELNHIFLEAVHLFGLHFIQIPNYQRFFQMMFLQYFQELVSAGYLKQTCDKVVINRRPEWFSDLDTKKQAMLKPMSAADQERRRS